MNWFEEQLTYRKELDDEHFAEAMEQLAGAVMGKRLSASINSHQVMQSAIEEILKYYHKKMHTDELPATVKTAEEQLEYRLRPFGISYRAVELDEGWYRYAMGAMLGTLKEDGRAVALIPGKLGGYSFFDSKTGKRVKLNGKTQHLLEKEAICFYEPLPLKSLNMLDLIKFMFAQLSVSDLVLYVGLMALATLLGMLSPLFTKWLFGGVLQSGNKQVLLALAVFMVCFSLSQLLFSAFQSLVNNRITTKQSIAVQAAVMNRTMSLPASFFKEFGASELAQRSSYVEGLCSLLFSTLGTTALSALFSLSYLGEVFHFAPSLVVPSLVVSLTTIAVSLITTFANMSIRKKIMLYSSKDSSIVYTMLTGIQKIKLAGAEKRMFARWMHHASEVAALEYNPPLFLKLSTTITMAVTLAGTMVIYFFAVKTQVSVSDYYAFNAAFGMVSAALTSLSSIAMTVANIKPTLDMARPILETEPELAEGKEIVTSLRGGIEINHVSFRYNENMPNVIDDLSLTIKPGEYVALVGSTGCGKSTLLRLLLGFETAQSGTIYYDRKDIARVDLKSLRRKIGTVMQDGKLFSGDIYSNIVISAPELTLDDAWEAAETASVADTIREMPMGMFTLISEGQGGISGGQRQRLMIARAVASKPKILMFDEATSALDNMTQKKVTEAIDKLKCTRIVIAHRLSTIRHADRILYLDKGRIAEQGTYEELIALGGRFAELVERQRLDV